MQNKPLNWLKTFIDRPATDTVSPLGRWLRGVLRSVEVGKLTGEFEVRPEMTNPLGVLHGGAAAAVIDEMIGATVYSLGRTNFYSTVNLNIDYLASARAGQIVTAKTEVIRQGQNIVNVECRLYNAKGRLLTKASANLIKTNAPVQLSADRASYDNTNTP